MNLSMFDVIDIWEKLKSMISLVCKCTCIASYNLYFKIAMLTLLFYINF